MKVLQINTDDSKGGAGNLTYAVHNSLRQLGIESKMLVQGNYTDDPDVYAISPLKGLKLSVNYRLRKYTGYDFWRVFPLTWLNREPIASADIINLHNIHGNYFNYFSLPLLSSKKKICWSLHDMWSFTGNCAYSYDCDRWITGCHDCPLHTKKIDGVSLMEPAPLPKDRSYSIWRIKRWLYKHSNMTIVVGSHWMKQQVEKSILKPVGEIVHIPDGTNLETFNPLSSLDREQLRQQYNLSETSKVILVYASANARKGFSFVRKALLNLPPDDDVVVLSVGWKDAPYGDLNKKFRIIQIGYVENDTARNELHNVADVFLMPTLQDNLSLAMLDSLASGLPIVAFDVGGVSEAIIHMENGYLASAHDASELAQGLSTILNDAELQAKMRHKARSDAELYFDHELSVKRYVDLYKSL